MKTGKARLLLSEAGSSIAESEEGDVGLEAPESVLEVGSVNLEPPTAFLEIRRVGLEVAMLGFECCAMLYRV